MIDIVETLSEFTPDQIKKLTRAAMTSRADKNLTKK
mgnify:CR=1 FL=1